ncbi:unannotated protein [freshwater metagenome]|uniref:Unannotated protein n=1 Tax=freshwater metagenome TaxID=449393 RepID=A0A6J7RJG2_9ZZZZ
MMMANVVGSTAAPPMPISALKPMSMPEETENAHTAEAAAKRIKPMIRIFFRPRRSPSTPQVKSKAAKAKI